MYRKLAVVTIIVLLLSLAFASVSFAQTGTGNQGQNNNQSQNNNNNQSQNNNNQSGNNQQGSGPNNAFTSAGSGRSVGQGQQHWYSFQYAGDNSPIQIRLRNASNLVFSVWTQQDIQNANGNYGATATPVGRSSSNDQFGGDQYWTGSFNTPGTYYVMVERNNGGQANGSGQYNLEITGSGVSFGQGNNNQSGSNANGSNNSSGSNTSSSTGANTTGRNTSSTGSNTSSTGSNTTGSNTSSGTGSSSARGGTGPSTLPRTGGEMASVIPMLIGGMGALSVAAGAMLRRKK